MERFFEYLDNEIFCHHTLDINPDPARFYLHVHEHMELFYLISGDGTYIVEGSQYVLKPHIILITRSAEAHKLNLNPHVPYERISIQFDAHVIHSIDPEEILLQPFLNRPLGKNNCYPSTDSSEAAIKNLFQAFDRFESSARMRLHVLKVLFNALSYISDEFNSIDANSYSNASGIAYQLIEGINANLFENISLSTISKKFYLSESQINRIFKKATGSTVGEYIRIKRLLAAREKILAGESASTASSSCGFSDYSTFYRAYKAHFGVSPSETNTILPIAPFSL